MLCMRWKKVKVLLFAQRLFFSLFSCFYYLVVCARVSVRVSFDFILCIYISSPVNWYHFCACALDVITVCVCTFVCPIHYWLPCWSFPHRSCFKWFIYTFLCYASNKEYATTDLYLKRTVILHQSLYLSYVSVIVWCVLVCLSSFVSVFLCVWVCVCATTRWNENASLNSYRFIRFFVSFSLLLFLLLLLLLFSYCRVFFSPSCLYRPFNGFSVDLRFFFSCTCLHRYGIILCYVLIVANELHVFVPSF